MLGWDLNSETAKDEIKHHPQLRTELEALKGKKNGLLIETVPSETGASDEQVIVPEADLSEGWDDRRSALVSGDVVVTSGEHGNTAIYRLVDGDKVGEFFGTAITTNAAAHLIAAVNREDEVLLVDEHTGKEVERFTLGSPVLAARIVTGKEAVLLVLTADQIVHRIPVP